MERTYTEGMQVRTHDDLTRMAEKGNLTLASEVPKIMVGMASCGLAAGADTVFKSFNNAANDHEFLLSRTGCIGFCQMEPLVGVSVPGKGMVLLHSVSPDMTSSIVDALASGALPSKQVLCSLDEQAASPEYPPLDKLDFFSKQKKITLRNCGYIDPESIAEYAASGGYQALLAALTQSKRVDVLKTIERSGLRGRGGAGFPTAEKWRITMEQESEEKFIICNADEGDPGAYMDRSILEGDPHSVVEGMIIGAYVIGSRQGIVYIRDEYPQAIAKLERAITDARLAGLLGRNIAGTDFSFDLSIVRGGGAFVCGEETALIASIMGMPGEPSQRPPFPAESGVWGKPTNINNVETWANVPYILANGHKEFASLGTDTSKGTKVFSLVGKIANTGLIEVPMGLTLREAVFEIGGGVLNRKQFKAVQTGGPSGGCLPESLLDLPVDYEQLNSAGTIMGSGGMIVMDEETCMVDVARYFLDFLKEESCGKCTPCREGISQMLDILNRMCDGEGSESDLELLKETAQAVKDFSQCGLGQTAANPVLSTLRHFRHEYEAHIRDSYCEAGVCVSLVRATCQNACPAYVDVPGFVSLVAEGRYNEALRLHRERNPFAAVCARVCFHTCEDRCQRISLDEPVSIRAVKRFLVDQEITIQVPKVMKNSTNARKQIAVIGAGPAGLSCAYFLCRLGYKPTVFEASTRPGGMLVQTIPAYRLPRETVAREVRMIERLGAKILTKQVLGRDFTLESLRDEGFEKIFIGVGTPDSVDIGIPGEDAQGVVQAVPFLQQYNIRGSVEVGEHVVVVGGGNAAVDAARTALRLGAQSVKIIYRRSKVEMPAYAEEVDEAVKEGIDILPLTQPVEIALDEKGHVAGLKCIAMELRGFDSSGRRKATPKDAPPFVMQADQIIVAIGQRLDPQSLFGDTQISINSLGCIEVNPVTGETSCPGIFSGGDCVDGPLTVVKAIASGERAAVGMDMQFTGSDNAFWRVEAQLDTPFDPDAEPVSYPRELLSVIPVERRVHNFEEVELPWSESVAQNQARRCLRCDYGKKPRRVPLKEGVHE